MGKNLTNIFITKANGSRVPIANRRTATDISSATQNWALNAEDTVSITVVSPFPQTYGIGDKITIFGRDYKLNRLPKVKKTGMHEFQYDLEFEGIQYDLFRVTYDVTIDTTTNELQDVQGDTLTGDLHRFMTVLVANANRVFPGKWVLGVCPETAGDKTLTFGESDNCLSVLQNLCGESNFNVEFEIEQSNGVYTINLYEKVGQTLPYTFQYGRGRGLYELTRENVSSANIVTRLKVYGSTENITSKYRADRLCLPGKTKGQSYIEKADIVAKYGIFEGRKNFDDIKPSYTGSITSVVTGNVLQFIDANFPFDLNEKEDDGETTKYLLSGISAKIHFNTGNLAGYEFEAHSYDHATHKFTLVKQTDERGNVFPSETSQAFQFGVGDEYKVLDIAYPSSIEQEAESKLAEEGNKYYDQNCQPKVQYGLKVTKEWLQKLVGSDETVTNVFQPGDYLHIVDGDIGVDKSVRIRSLERNILDPYEYDLTISDTVTTNVTNRVISDLVEIDKVITINNLKDPARARANWRTSRELLNMVFDPDGDYYSDKIKPLSIDTLALSVGAKSMQFGLLNTVFQPNYNGNANVVKWKGGVLTHYTINVDSAVSWTMADGTVTLSNNQAYYLYAKCARSGNAGTFIFSTSQIKVEQDANYYHFLVGTISSVDPELNVRSLALTYGFTMVNGRFIKTGRIESADGLTYFDLDNSEIGGNIKFRSADGTDKEVSGLEDILKQQAENFADIIAGMQDQIDGTIESHFYDFDPSINDIPASLWLTDKEKESHLNDTFTNLKTGYSWRWTLADGVYKWTEITDTAVSEALKIAGEAKDAADNKRRVFVTTPYPPYDVGDLWVDGKELRRCVNPKTKTGTYSPNDWAIAVYYDNTKTTIDGGLVTSGTIQVAGDEASILAGMTGNGTTADSVRFWAGTAFENRTTAPFRVLQSGDAILSKLHAIGAEILNKQGDMMKMSIVGTHIIGTTRKETDLIISNENNPGLGNLDEDRPTVPTNISPDTGFTPPINDDYYTGYDEDDVFLEYNECELLKYDIGYLSSTTIIKQSAAPVIFWKCPFWYPIEDGLPEYNPDMLFGCKIELIGLELWLYKDGIQYCKLAHSENDLSAGTKEYNSGNNGAGTVTLIVDTNTVNVTEGGVFSLRIICQKMKMTVNAQEYNYSEKYLNTFVNVVSYPIEDGDFVVDPYFIMRLSSLSVSISFPAAYNGFEGLAMYRNGFVHKNSGGRIKFSEDYFEVMFSNYGLRISNKGIQKTSNSGGTWTTI